MSAEAAQQRSAAKVRAAIFAGFALIATAITTTVQGVEGNFAFWIDRVGGSQVGFSIPVVLLWAALSLELWATAILQYTRGARFRWRLAIGFISPLLLFAAI
uniref:hypothetical protein n=1 Tax=Candidatus Limnocylindrus sp. TaxID=2802978 RepID=UPI004049D97A